MGELSDKIKGGINSAIGDAKQDSDDPNTRAEGENQELKGELQKKKGSIEGALGNDV